MPDLDAHTPGPWHYVGGAVWADSDGSIGIAARISQSIIPPYERDNNLRLCAAAPALLAGAEALVAWFRFGPSASGALNPVELVLAGCPNELSAVVAALRETIRAARGEAPAHE